MDLFKGSIITEEKTYPLRPGYISLIPPSFQYELIVEDQGCHFFAHITFEGVSDMNSKTLFQSPCTDLTHCIRQFESAISCFPSQPVRSESKIWDLLWELASSPCSLKRGKHHPALEYTASRIEAAMGQSLKPAELAKEANISLRQLDRLFKNCFGRTVAKYINMVRTARAFHLLLHTDKPVKWIAVEVGIPDLQAFNKLFRREYGLSPRKTREKAGQEFPP